MIALHGLSFLPASIVATTLATSSSCIRMSSKLLLHPALNPPLLINGLNLHLALP
jgi:hypothetical protein